VLDKDLLPAERRLLEDGALDLRTGDDAADDPAGGLEWPVSRTVRGEVLRAVWMQGSLKLILAGVRITGAVDVEGAAIERSLTLDGCYIDETLNLQDAELVSLRLPGCRMPLGINARGSRIRGNLDLDRGFCAEAEVVLAAASVGGNLTATEGRFLNPNGSAILAVSVSVDGSVLLGNGFEAEGSVALHRARIRGILNCSGGHFRNPGGVAFVCDGVSADGGMTLSRGFEAEGMVSLVDAEIHGSLGCDGGRFTNPGGYALLADRLTVHGGVFCRDGFRADGEVRLNGATIEGQFVLQSAVISCPDRLALDLEGAQVRAQVFLEPENLLDGWVDLRSARFGLLYDSPNAWHSGYELGGCQYRTLRSSWELNNRRRFLRRDTAVSQRLAWLAGNSSGYLPQIYDQLIEVYAASGEEAPKRDVLIAKQRQRRGQLPWYAWLWNVGEDILIGFGYRTGRALIPFAIFLALGWWYFGNAYDDGEIVERSTAATINEPPFKPLIYSLDQLVPVVNFGQRENWVATGDAQTLVTIMVIVGWILTTAILAALTGLVRRNQ
jgi:hypothetical protein